MARVTIIGLGRIGTSLGLALKASQPKLEVVGHDLRSDSMAAARKLGAVDKTEWNLPAALEGAGLVVVSIPLGGVAKLFGEMARFLSENCVVTDTLSLKGPVLSAAAENLPSTVSFVGGHPVAHPEMDPNLPDAQLFAGQAYAIVASPTAREAAIAQVIRLAELVGAKPFIVDETEHDAYAASFEQIPALLAAALTSLAAGQPGWRDAQRLASARFAALTAPAADAPVEQQARLLGNRELLLARVEALQAELADLAALLREGSADELLKRLTSANQQRAAWHPGAPPP
ncbi:MAG TPA: prephenate dehydrogenase, partial [Chloroflexota bacterium]|nr:prephenate dehydrogenase [Chloroflexota bacterium]